MMSVLLNGTVDTTYTYDAYGNILSKAVTKNGTTTTIPYTYGTDSDAGWSKLLKAYNGQTIDYDAIGNPTTYLGASLDWSNGRQLTSYTKGGNTSTYTYDADGLRVTKTVNGTKHTYLYVDGLLMYEKRGDKELYFWYDGNGHLAAIRYYYNTDGDWVNLYALTNAMGDVLALYGGSGALLVTYEYDAWGNLVYINDTTALGSGTANPIRYRGYYYDTDTGLYYCQSRYYDPQVGRFISPEPNVYSGKFDEGAGLLGHNVYAYCANNAVIYKDVMGESITLATCVIIGAIVGAVAGATASYMIYGKVNGWWVLGGAVVGGVLGYFGGAFFGASGIKAGTLASKVSMSKIRWLGKIGEKLSKLPKNTKHITSLTKSAKYRIPDYLDDANKIIGDVKNVKKLSYTSQLKDFMLYAEKHGYTFVLKIRKSTQLSGTLKKLVDSGKIALLYF